MRTLRLWKYLMTVMQWERITEEAVKAFGQIDVLINNGEHDFERHSCWLKRMVAGWSYTNKKTATVTEEEFDRVRSTGYSRHTFLTANIRSSSSTSNPFSFHRKLSYRKWSSKAKADQSVSFATEVPVT